MNSLSTVRTPEIIAAEINTIKIQTRKIVLYNSIEIGRRLTEAKSLLSHGEWGEWLEKSVDYSKSTANNLMRIFDEYGSDQITLLDDNAKNDALGNLSYTQAVALLGIPAEEREVFVRENDIDNMSTRELQKAIKERDELAKKLENAKKTAVEKSEEAKKLLEEKQKAERDARLSEKVLRETQKDVKMLQDTLKKEREKREQEVQKLESQIVEANKAGNFEEADKLAKESAEARNQLDEANRRIHELERQLKEKPLEVTATKIPEEVERELQKLREKAKQSNDDTARFKVYFDVLVKDFSAMLDALDEIGDQGTQEKYKKAVHTLIGKMSERVG